MNDLKHLERAMDEAAAESLARWYNPELWRNAVKILADKKLPGEKQ